MYTRRKECTKEILGAQWTDSSEYELLDSHFTKLRRVRAVNHTKLPLALDTLAEEMWKKISANENYMMVRERHPWLDLK